MTATLTWSFLGGTYQPALVAGDAAALPDLGVSSNNTSGPLWAGPLVNVGTPVSGSVRGVEVGFGPNFWIGGPVYLSPLVFLTFDWTAPATPGIVEFSWMPRADVPNALFYPVPSLTPVALPTTYLGTSITVIPAPAPAAALALAGLAMGSGGRRRPNP